MTQERVSHGQPAHNAHGALAVITVCAIVLTAAVLRAPLTSLGVLSMTVQQDLALSAATMGLLTTLPLLAFAASATFMSAIGNHFGKELVLAVGGALIAGGILMRSSLGGFGLFAGTTLMGLGISAGNVLLPAIVKDRFPLALGAMTALYTTTMSVFAGSAAGLSATMTDGGLPWQATLALLAPVAAVGALLWALLHRQNHRHDEPKRTAAEDQLATKPSLRLSRLLHPGMLRSPLTWWITGLFALQSILFYCMVAWMPSILAAQGISGSTIALCAALFPIMGIPCTIFVPPLAQKLKRQRLLGALIGAFCAVGTVLLGFATTDWMAVLAMAIFGFALGAPFCLCMFYFSARTANATDAARLSSIAQTFGYLLAAIGPACMGTIFDLTGTWIASLTLMVLIAAGLALCGWKSGTGTLPPQEG